MAFDAVIFDLDGTLTDSAPGLLASFRHMHQQMGWPVPDDAVLRSWLGPPMVTILRDQGHDEVAIAEASGVFRDYLVEHGFSQQQIFDGIEEMLDGLRAAGLPMAVATFKLQGDAELVTGRLGLDARMDAVHGRIGDEGGHSKAPVIGRALASLGLGAGERIAMVGDRSHDIASAAELGLTTIGVSYGYGGAVELYGAGANHVVASVAELRDILSIT